MPELSRADLRLAAEVWLLALLLLAAWACNLDVGEPHRIDPGITTVSQPVPRMWHEIAPADAGDTRLPKAEDAGE